MKRYSKSKMDSFYPDPKDKTRLQEDCIVEISGEALVVKYMQDGKLVEYVGVADGKGHYLITGKGFPATGTLHISDGRMLEGSWKEDSYHGMWRIFLEEHD